MFTVLIMKQIHVNCKSKSMERKKKLLLIKTEITTVYIYI